MDHTADRIRLRISLESHDRALNDLTSATPMLWRGTDWQIDLAWDLCGILVGMAGISSITLEVKPLSAPTGPALLSSTIDSSDIDNTLTEASWADYTQQHASFRFANTDTNLDLGSANSADFYLIAKAWTNEVPARRSVLAVTLLRVDEAGINDTAPPEPGDPNYYTAAQSDARYVQSIGVANGLQTTGGLTPTLSLPTATTAGQVLTWKGTAWEPGNTSGAVMILCDDGALCPLIGVTIDGRHVPALGPRTN